MEESRKYSCFSIESRLLFFRQIVESFYKRISLIVDQIVNLDYAGGREQMSRVRRATRRFVTSIRDLSREIDDRATRIVQEERSRRFREEYNMLRRFSQGEDLASLQAGVKREEHTK